MQGWNWAESAVQPSLRMSLPSPPIQHHPVPPNPKRILRHFSTDKYEGRVSSSTYFDHFRRESNNINNLQGIYKIWIRFFHTAFLLTYLPCYFLWGNWAPKRCNIIIIQQARAFRGNFTLEYPLQPSRDKLSLMCHSNESLWFLAGNASTEHWPKSWKTKAKMCNTASLRLINI